MAKKFKHKLASTEHNYDFRCDDAKLFKQVAAVIKGLTQPPTSVSPLSAQPSHASVSYYHTSKSPNAYAWVCLSYPDPTRKITAIKTFRDVTKHTLADSKHWVEGSKALLLEPVESEALWDMGFVMRFA